MFIDFEDLNPEICSICCDCAKDITLKKYIENHFQNDNICGICLRDPRILTYKSANLDYVSKLSNLLKSLIRYYFNEWEYNHHWGGAHSATSILQEENPIVFHEINSYFNRMPEWTEVFFDHLLDPPYPDPGEGIWIYAGFDDGTRLVQRSISSQQSHIFQSFVRRLKGENHFQVEPDLIKIFQEVGDRIDKIVPPASRYSRARIGVNALYMNTDGFDGKLEALPYQGKLLGAPPPGTSSAGRLNRPGVSFTYLATDDETAIAEVRPHPGHKVSVGHFECHGELRIADFNADISKFSNNEIDLQLFEFLITISRHMSEPVVPGSEKKYAITQLVAEALRQLEFDGVSFPSSVGSGSNFCVFDNSKISHIDGSAKVFEIKNLKYGFKDFSTVLSEPEFGFKVK